MFSTKSFGPIFVALLSLLLATQAEAASCGPDIQKLVARRDAIMAEIGAIPSPGEQSTLDPATACPRLKTLAAVLGETVSYFETNTQECGIAEAVTQSVVGQRERIAAATARLCGSAGKARAKKAP
jgi:hypothetical protein